MQRAEALENTVKASRADPEMFKFMLPQLLQTCEQRLSELSRAIAAAKAGAAAGKGAGKAAAAASKAAEAKIAVATAEQLPELGPVPIAFLVERGIRKLFPLDTPEHHLLRTCAEYLLLDASKEGRTALVNGEEVTLKKYQEVGARICNVPEVIDATKAARAAGVTSTGALLRSHAAFEVQEHSNRQGNSTQWLVRLRAERLPDHASIQRSVSAVIDALLPSARSSSSASAGAAAGGSARPGAGAGAAGASSSRRGADGSGEVLPRPAVVGQESSEEVEVLRRVAQHLLEARSAKLGYFKDSLDSVAKAVPSRLQNKYAGGPAGLEALKRLMNLHPLFWGVRKWLNVSGEPSSMFVGLDTDLCFNYEWRARQLQPEAQQGGRKRRAEDGAGSPDGAEDNRDLSTWWREQRGKKHRR
ncbi:hypothetical protein GPECTOR_22g850 [Gonium pectorale]|uniref:Uncharacterized protein n=1 Tax=Gonium pectorale TaxID=33097 RepID=A0A150GHH0_GONPE|nr:hypothetical protein GPECTOR_22g850 [Gonium pectorale]|eukprot:KXZ49257.1 hypothetical protein GPECTOR_22g850 [Gonium pectorale]